MGVGQNAYQFDNDGGFANRDHQGNGVLHAEKLVELVEERWSRGGLMGGRIVVAYRVACWVVGKCKAIVILSAACY